jgi:hypothetical protein
MMSKLQASFSLITSPPSRSPYRHHGPEASDDPTARMGISGHATQGQAGRNEVQLSFLHSTFATLFLTKLSMGRMSTVHSLFFLLTIVFSFEVDMNYLSRVTAWRLVIAHPVALLLHLTPRKYIMESKEPSRSIE